MNIKYMKNPKPLRFFEPSLEEVEAEKIKREKKREFFKNKNLASRPPTGAQIVFLQALHVKPMPSNAYVAAQLIETLKKEYGI